MKSVKSGNRKVLKRYPKGESSNLKEMEASNVFKLQNRIKLKVKGWKQKAEVKG